MLETGLSFDRNIEMAEQRSSVRFPEEVFLF